jgi:integrase
MRHSYAGLLLTQGASIVYVKEQLGHSSIQMTVDTYGALIPSANRDEVNRLDTIAPQPHPARARGRQNRAQ